MRSAFLVTLMVVAGLSLAQEEGATDEEVVVEEEGVPQEVAPGVTIVVNPGAAMAQYEVAREIEYQPERVESTIGFGDSFTGVTVSLSSRVDTRVRLEVDDPEHIVPVRQDDVVTVLSGYRVAVGFTAYEPHSGTIRIYNEENALLAVVPYTVRAQGPVRQSIGASVSAGGATFMENDDVRRIAYEYEIDASYAITERTTGITGRVNVGFDGEFEFGGQVSGEYSW